VNRLDDMIVFRPLIKDDLNQIIEFELSKLRKRLTEKGMALEIDQKAKDFLIDKGYNPDFGARPLRRSLSQFVEDPLAENLLSGEFAAGDVIFVTREDEKEHLAFRAQKPTEVPPPATPTAA